ncbi:hypothetical protein B4168_2197 [Anoxybacillus flavithermus]|nr:hypothetical protein B4168_2197 [Anoxybacillus flavithermus]OAO85853.1 hypothetical protein GT23_2756 [Parageobacillus thermoglucosidasius]
MRISYNRIDEIIHIKAAQARAPKKAGQNGSMRLLPFIIKSGSIKEPLF